VIGVRDLEKTSVSPSRTRTRAIENADERKYQHQHENAKEGKYERMVLVISKNFRLLLREPGGKVADC
jgi:hypothetical protein